MDLKTVMVVEDDPSLRVVLRLVLERAGYAVIEAAHGKEAIQTMAQAAPDLVLADISMPFMGGIELTSRMRATAGLSGIPVVLLSGHAVTPAGHAADAVVLKPFDPPDLVATVSRVLDAHTGPRLTS